MVLDQDTLHWADRTQAQVECHHIMSHGPAVLPIRQPAVRGESAELLLPPVQGVLLLEKLLCSQIP